MPAAMQANGFAPDEPARRTVVGVQDEDPPHGPLDHRIDDIGLGRDAERHAQEVAGVGQ